MKRLSFSIIVAVAAAACGATKLKVDPVRVEPIHMTIDVNLHDQTDLPMKKP